MASRANGMSGKARRCLGLGAMASLALLGAWQAQAQTRPWSSDPAVRMRNALEADMNRHGVAANAQSQRVMESNLRAIDARFGAFHAAVEEYERERRAATAGSAVVLQTPLQSTTAQAESGDVEAMRTLGAAMVAGVGVPRDLARGESWLLRAAERGDNFARAFMGARLLWGESSAAPAAKGLEFLNQAATNGHRDALAYLGMAYAEGSGLPRDAARASELLRRAALAGSPVGLYRHAHALLTGLSGVPDVAQAAQWMARAASTGLPDAVATWGGFLVHGHGVSKDLAKGLALVRQAADAGSPKGLGMWGTFQFEGLGMPRDVPAAVRAWEQAVTGGYHYPAAHNLATVLRHGDTGVLADPARARRFALAAAQGGDAEMASLIGRMLLTGEGGPVDVTAALPWLRAAASSGEPVAQTNLAWQLQRGEGVPRDLAAAGKLYSQAAHAGVANAQFWWARFLLGGVGGVQQNPQEGAAWLRKAASQDQAEAQLELGRLLLGGFGPVQADRQQALGFLRKAGEARAPAVAGPAQTLLGVLHEEGQFGLPVNPAQAATHYERSLVLKHTEGTARLGLMLALGTGVPADIVRARSLIDLAFATQEPWGLAAMAFLHERGISMPKDLRRGLTLYQSAVKAGASQFQSSVDRVRKALEG